MSDEWFYKRGESTFGPVSSTLLAGLMQRNKLMGSTLVRRDGCEDWTPLSQVTLNVPPTPAPHGLSQEQDSFASNLPGAAVVYAPPKSAPIMPEPGPPTSLWTAMAITSIFLVFYIFVWISKALIHLSHIISPEKWPDWLYELGNILAEHLSPIPQIAATLGKLLLLVIWQGCAFASIRRLYGDAMLRHGPASGFWWITPIANLFMPFFCLRELRHLSRKRRDLPQEGPPFGPLLWTLEILIGLGLVGSVCKAWLIMRTMHADDQDIFAQWFNLLASFQGIMLSIVLLMVVIGNLFQQVRLYRHWNNDAHWLTA
ncbi:MAG: GYF domain-containing protein [Verrucomicrobiaceae bacterium]